MPLPMNEDNKPAAAWKFGLLRQCDLRQVPFIKIAAGGVFLFKKMSFFNAGNFSSGKASRDFPGITVQS
ncbi:hypothetical protein [uncultured Akkermansia sp.]|uniref:hypothetical protein n=1 Tax=uncultured Akkermansia sp. TaxID=512294 RepID=UPI0026223672|nr:hypothetical protein [uncultured Akkermansia sp.]